MITLTIPPDKRPSASELAAQSNGADPWACPRCGCADWRVVNTYLIDGKRRRQRACRNCHTPLITYEVPCPNGHSIEAVEKGVIRPRKPP
jgi:hypothetical protein